MSKLLPKKLSEKEKSLFRAIERKDTGSLKRLLDDGVDPNAAEWSSRHGNYTALMYAAACQFPQGVQLLIEAGANVHAQTIAGAGAAGGTTALHRAIDGSDPTGTDAQGYSDPKQRLQVVELLLKAGANPFAVYDEDITPLGRAASSGYLEIVKMILERGQSWRRSLQAVDRLCYVLRADTQMLWSCSWQTVRRLMKNRKMDQRR